MKRMITFAISILLALAVQAQQQYHILGGSVKDQDGKPIAGAHIQMGSYSATTATSGGYQIDIYDKDSLDFVITVTAEGHAAYTTYCSFEPNESLKEMEFTLCNRLDYDAHRRSTLMLPITPDAAWGRYYRLDRVNGDSIIFEQELSPQANTPYVFVPNADLHLDLKDMDLTPAVHFSSIQVRYNYEENQVSGEGEVIFFGSYSCVEHPMLSENSFVAPIDDDNRDDLFNPMRPKLFYHFLLFLNKPVLCFNDYQETYHPFIEKGKTWCVDGFSLRPEHTTTHYYFSLDKALYVFDGREYSKMCSRTGHEEETIVGFFREEDQRVYLYDEKAKREYLIYDFTLKEGDKFEPEYGYYYNCEVMKVGTINVNGENLKTITFEANSHRSDAAVRMEVEWIEGVGLSTGPIEHNRSDWEYFTAYVYAGSYFLPFSFDMPYNGWHGCPFTPGIELPSDNPEIGLTYELVPDPEHDSYALHVYGTALLPCCQNHYVYCIEERGEDLKTCKLRLSYEEVGEAMDGERVYALDLYFRFFEPDAIQYIVVDQDGSEHSLWINDKDRPYRPFIEEGKVWRTGIQPGNDCVQQFEYKFYNDTIIGGKTCKTMVRSKLNKATCAPMDTIYVGAFYEKNHQVYYAAPGQETFQLLYDFGSAVGSEINLDGINASLTRRQPNLLDGFKGLWTEVLVSHENYTTFWMEGIGGLSNPMNSLPGLSTASSQNEVLLSCYYIATREVIYSLNNKLDGPSEVKKKWLDFTHVVKPRPKSPQRVSASKEDASGEGAATSDEAAEQETLKGEYSARELFVSLKTLTGAYTVTLTDAAGEVVYRKDVQTSNVVALNTLLTDYPDGEYTLTVENAEEQYTALLSLPLVDDAVRDLLDDKSVNSKSVNGKWSDLSGRHLNSQPIRKGIYIKDGRKVLIK
ncbi:MAG: carboxypeptidase regulatory-like domain-containing protein [Bacteroidaceae bacterium]|nr:carboxypeptidase regulatory-like domain-containing protein [Bacteroidaceae bacterium]